MPPDWLCLPSVFCCCLPLQCRSLKSCDASWTHVSTTQYPRKQEAFSLAPEQNIAAALAAVKSLSAEELASDSATDAALSDGARRRPRGGKRRCMGAANDSDGAPPYLTHRFNSKPGNLDCASVCRACLWVPVPE